MSSVYSKAKGERRKEKSKNHRRVKIGCPGFLSLYQASNPQAAQEVHYEEDRAVLRCTGYISVGLRLRDTMLRIRNAGGAYLLQG